MPSQIERLQAHAAHLLDAFIHLRERFAMLEPMLFDERVPTLRASGRQRRGFLILRNTLFLSCAQDIAKLATDSDKRTPSIANMILALADPSVESYLREAFSNWHAPLVEQETDPEIIEAIRLMHLRESELQALQFDESLARVREQWKDLQSSTYLSALQTIRDKVTAHTEVRFVADKYQLVDVGTLGLKWAELRQAISHMQQIVAGLNLVIRNAGFAWELLDSQLSRASQEFWLPAGAAA